MPNANYRKGADYERKLVNHAKNCGCLAFRSAGSHSPVDVCVFDEREKVVWFIQAKIGKKSQKKLKKEFERELKGFTVKFKVFEG